MEYKEKIREKVITYKFQNVIFQPYQKRELLELSLNVPDVHWVTLDPLMEGSIVPSKFYGILAAGKPTIFVGDPNGELAEAKLLD